MKQENKLFLDQYREGLVNAYHYNHIEVPDEVFPRLKQIYLEETGEDLDINYNCQACTVYLAAKCGKLYFTQYPEYLPPKDE